MANPLKPTASMRATMAVDASLVKPTTSKNVASNPNPKISQDGFCVIYKRSYFPSFDEFLCSLPPQLKSFLTLVVERMPLALKRSAR